MARSPGSARTHDLSKEFSGDVEEGLVSNALSRAKIVDLDHALSTIAEAEQLIQVQKKRIAYLETLALNDEVTGLINRRGYMQALQRELSAARRDPQAGGLVLMFDLDDFKSINDTHGHAAGDAYLAAFAAVLNTELRPSDVVARLGGDEFAVIMTRVAVKPGMARAQAILKSINAKSMSWRNHSLPMRTSMGMAGYTGRDIAEAVMVSADLKLYADKQKRKRAMAK